MPPRSAAPYVGIIHATTLSMAPLTAALGAELPQARIRHLLDDSLLPDLQAAGRITGALAARIERLVGHLVSDDVDAVQLACSGFAEVVDRLRPQLSTPVLKPDEAMYAEIVAGAHRHIGIVATVRPSADFASAQLTQLARSASLELRITTACRPEGMRAAQEGDEARFSRVIAEAAGDLAAGGAEVIALAQYSISPVAGDVAAATGLPVYTAPGAAARSLRRLVGPSSERPAERRPG